MSKQIAWSFAQAFVADDELTSQGDSDFMKYGVSLAALVSFFSQAVGQASISGECSKRRSGTRMEHCS